MQQVYVYGREKDLPPFLFARLDVQPTSLNDEGFLTLSARIDMMTALLACAETQDVTTIDLVYSSPESERVHEERWTLFAPQYGLNVDFVGDDGRRFHLEYERKKHVRHYEI
jgi:hypothetical protein